ncbi:uncharacterized protein METZ01_LOCUS386689, partial [marine metagenome]
SGNDIHRYCCQDCYCPIYINVTRSGGMYLYTGTLDNISDITFSENINFENGHFEYLNISNKKIEI